MHAAESVEHREASNQNNTHNRLPRSGSPHDAMHLSSNIMHYHNSTSLTVLRTDYVL